MDSTEILVTVAGLLLIAATLWFFFGQRDEIKTDRKAETEKALYACPMHPWITSPNAAANCSICGMKLVRNENTTSESTFRNSHH